MRNWVAWCFLGVKAILGNNMENNGYLTVIPSKCIDNFYWITGFCTEETMLKEEIIYLDFLVSVLINPQNSLMPRDNVSEVSKSLLQNRYKLLHKLSLLV